MGHVLFGRNLILELVFPACLEIAVGIIVFLLIRKMFAVEIDCELNNQAHVTLVTRQKMCVPATIVNDLIMP